MLQAAGGDAGADEEYCGLALRAASQGEEGLLRHYRRSYEKLGRAGETAGTGAGGKLEE